MNDKEYWNKRAEQRILMGEKSADELLTTMKTVYNNSLKDINKEIEAFYGRYAENNNLTLTEVHKRLDPTQLKSAKEEIKRYYDDVDKLARNKDGTVDVSLLRKYKDELRLQSAKAYMSRLEELKLGLKNITVNLGINESEAYYQTLSKIYSDNYKRTNFDIDKFLGFSTGFESLNYKQLNTAIHQRWLGMNFSDRIWKNKGQLLDQINTTFLQGVAQGHNSKKIALEMAKNMGTSYHNCERLVRTECAHIAGQATLEGYKERGTKKYKYDATLDNRTSEICQSLDGQVFDVKEAQEGINYPPMHPNCRSSTSPYFEPDDIDKMFDEAQRVARDENGELYYVPASMTYKEWQEMTSHKPTYNPDKIPDGFVFGVDVHNKLNILNTNTEVDKLYDNYSEYEDDELQAIDEYVRKLDGVDMNQKLNNNQLNDLSQNQIDDIMMKLDKALLRNKINHDIVVIRALKEHNLKWMFNPEQIEQLKNNNLDSLGYGRKWKQNGFISTSWNQKNSVKECDLYLLINIPKGTPVIPMNSKVNKMGMKGEKELLFGRGYTIVSTGKARTIDGKNYLIVDLKK